MGKPNTADYCRQFAKAYGLSSALRDDADSAWLDPVQARFSRR